MRSTQSVATSGARGRFGFLRIEFILYLSFVLLMHFIEWIGVRRLVEG